MVNVVVVDNDPAGSAESAVYEVKQAGFPFELSYVLESTPGIARARNTGVRASAGAECVAFIDDDEEAEPQWLAELLAARSLIGAGVVLGPVLARLSDLRCSSWLTRFLCVSPGVSGPAPVTAFKTGNVLIGMELLRGLIGPFNEAFALSGGEDTELGLRLWRGGARFWWNAEARVWEHVPPGRLRPAWLLRRAFRTGNALVFCHRAVFPAGQWWRLSVRVGVASLAWGFLKLPPCVFLGPARLLGALVDLARGCGVIAALAGFRYEEYRTHPPPPKREV